MGRHFRADPPKISIDTSLPNPTSRLPLVLVVSASEPVLSPSLSLWFGGWGRCGRVEERTSIMPHVFCVAHRLVPLCSRSFGPPHQSVWISYSSLALMTGVFLAFVTLFLAQAGPGPDSQPRCL